MLLTQPAPQAFRFSYSVIATVLASLMPFLLLLSRSTAELILVVTDVIFLFKCHQHNHWRWLKTPWLILFGLFVLYVLLINTPLSLSPVDSMSYALLYLRWPIFAIAMGYWVLQTPNAIKPFFITLGICLLYLIFDSWLQYLSGVDILGKPLYPLDNTIPPDRLTGPFNKPIIGIMLVRLLFIAILAVLFFKPLQRLKSQFLFSLSMLIIGLLTIFISGERMAFILCVFGFISLLGGYLLSYKQLRIKVGLGLILAGIVISLAALNMPSVTDRMLVDGLAKLQFFWTSDYGAVFKSAWQAWQQHWWFGSGLHTYREHCETLGLLAQYGMHCSHPHNLYLQLGAETGIIGVSMFSMMLLSLYTQVIKPHIQTGNWWLAALVLTILNTSFWPLIGGISILNNWVAALVWLGVGWCLAMTMHTPNSRRT